MNISHLPFFSSSISLWKISNNVGRFSCAVNTHHLHRNNIFRTAVTWHILRNRGTEIIKFENQHKYVSDQNIVKCLFPFVDGNSVYKNCSNWIPWDYYKAVLWVGSHYLCKSRPWWVNCVLVIRKKRKSNELVIQIKVLF